MYRILSSLLAIVILSIVSWQAFREGNYLGGALAAAISGLACKFYSICRKYFCDAFQCLF